MVKVKICGIMRKEDLEAAVSAGVDMVGFIVGVPSSPRNLKNKDAEHLISMVPSGIVSVAVTVLDGSECLEDLFNLGADRLQLHGEPQILTRLAEKDLPWKGIIGVVNARLANMLELSIKYAKSFEAVLVDSLKEGCIGGTGEAHDWVLSRMVRDTIYPHPLILAGGLTPENVGKAVSIVEPYGVDVSSGVESSPGIKDCEKMLRFVSEARRMTAYE